MTAPPDVNDDEQVYVNFKITGLTNPTYAILAASLLFTVTTWRFDAGGVNYIIE